MTPNTKQPSRKKRVLLSLLAMLLTTAISAGLGWILSLLAPPLNPFVDELLNMLSLPPTDLWIMRFWQLVSFLAGLLTSSLVGVLLQLRARSAR